MRYKVFGPHTNGTLLFLSREASQQYAKNELAKQGITEYLDRGHRWLHPTKRTGDTAFVSFFMDPTDEEQPYVGANSRVQSAMSILADVDRDLHSQLHYIKEELDEILSLCDEDDTRPYYTPSSE